MEEEDAKRFYNLHSNMVKFKLIASTKWQEKNTIYIPIWLNSNQFADTVFFNRINYLHSNMVKFKCGTCPPMPKPFLIYIPIWLNSNDICELGQCWSSGFTFQYG